MQTHILFLPAAPSDADTLADIRVDAMRESLERVGRFDPVRARDRLLRNFSPGHTFHVLLDGRKVGFYVLKPDGDGLVLDHLYIQPGNQGQGLGAAVLAEVFTRAGAQGCPVRVVALKESASNRFYLRHGFVRVAQSEFDNHYVRPAGRPAG